MPSTTSGRSKTTRKKAPARKKTSGTRSRTAAKKKSAGRTAAKKRTSGTAASKKKTTGRASKKKSTSSPKRATSRKPSAKQIEASLEAVPEPQPILAFDLKPSETRHLGWTGRVARWTKSLADQMHYQGRRAA